MSLSNRDFVGNVGMAECVPELRLPLSPRLLIDSRLIHVESNPGNSRAEGIPGTAK
jgi:hypothetical protein